MKDRVLSHVTDMSSNQSNQLIISIPRTCPMWSHLPHTCSGTHPPHLLRNRPSDGEVHEAAVVRKLPRDGLGAIAGRDIHAQRVECCGVAQHLA